MQRLLAAAQQMQEQLRAPRSELAEAEVEGTVGGGLVTVIVNGTASSRVRIKAAAIDPVQPEDSARRG